MSDKIGVLGETTATAIATTAVYTVPTAKAAKCQIMFRLKANAGGGNVVSFVVNGLTIGKTGAMTADFYTFSIKGAGLMVAEQAAEPTGVGSGLTVAPADQIYYLNAGDSIQVVNSGATLAEMSCQVVGIEVDV